MFFYLEKTDNIIYYPVDRSWNHPFYICTAACLSSSFNIRESANASHSLFLYPVPESIWSALNFC